MRGPSRDGMEPVTAALGMGMVMGMGQPPPAGLVESMGNRTTRRPVPDQEVGPFPCRQSENGASGREAVFQRLEYSLALLVRFLVFVDRGALPRAEAR